MWQGIGMAIYVCTEEHGKPWEASRRDSIQQQKFATQIFLNERDEQI